MGLFYWKIKLVNRRGEMEMELRFLGSSLSAVTWFNGTQFHPLWVLWGPVRGTGAVAELEGGFQLQLTAGVSVQAGKPDNRGPSNCTSNGLQISGFPDGHVSVSVSERPSETDSDPLDCDRSEPNPFPPSLRTSHRRSAALLLVDSLNF